MGSVPIGTIDPHSVAKAIQYEPDINNAKWLLACLRSKRKEGARWLLSKDTQYWKKVELERLV